MKKNHEFHPTLNGRLEDRLVLNGAHVASAAHVVPHAVHAQQTTPTGAVNFTTLRYYNIVQNIHSAFTQFGKSQGSVADTNRLLNKVYGQVKYIPFAVQDGLVSTLRADIEGTAPADYRSTYSTVRSDILSDLSSGVGSGAVVIVKSKGPSHWTDKEIYGPNATFSNV
jgi:hypothetical protein